MVIWLVSQPGSGPSWMYECNTNMNYNTYYNISMICFIYCPPLLPQVSPVALSRGQVAQWYSGMCGGCKLCLITPLYQCNSPDTGWEGTSDWRNIRLHCRPTAEQGIDCRHSSWSSSFSQAATLEFLTFLIKHCIIIRAAGEESGKNQVCLSSLYSIDHIWWLQSKK